MKRRRSERDGLEGDDEGFESSPEKVSEIECLSIEFKKNRSVQVTGDRSNNANNEDNQDGTENNSVPAEMTVRMCRIRVTCIQMLF